MSEKDQLLILDKIQISRKIERMYDSLVGFWGKDDWDARECPEPSAIEYAKTPSLRNRWIRFGQIDNVWIRTELKYFYYSNIRNGNWNARTVWKTKGTAINQMIGFLNSKYPDIQSITDLYLNETLTEFRTYLIEKGVRPTITNYKLDSKNNRIAVEANSYYVTNFKQFIEFYLDYYFDGEEWEKDVWDRRKLTLSEDKVNLTQHEYQINFSRIQNRYFKKEIKRYCKLKLNTVSYSYVIDIARILGFFFNFITKNYPNVNRIKQIKRIEVENYISEINNKGYSPSTVIGQISIVKTFFEDITKFDWEDQPRRILIYHEDFPRESKATPRFIDDFVLEQLNDKVDKLDQTTAAMVLIIQESGMRISELCTLEKKCVITDSEGDCFLRYYQIKMKKEHIIPISRDLAALIKNQEKVVENNFHIKKTKYLFPRKDGSPVKQDTFRRNLNELAYNENIVDKNGEIFRFHSHAFRHTVGTKMINSGVPQHIVQKFLGHESPEMTSRYAHIFDETMKKEFRKFRETLVSNQGSIINLENNNADDTDLQWFKQNINAQALPNGYCRLPVVAGACPHANACLDCTHFCTSKMFLKEHEQHLDRTREVIEKAKQNQWQRQVEMNEHVEFRLTEIINTLKEETLEDE